jgi:hypothetical protein
LSTQIEQIRDQVKQVLARANADSAYFAQLQSDPAGTLVAAGVPAEATPDLLGAEPEADHEVFGYVCTITQCFTLTLWW